MNVDWIKWMSFCVNEFEVDVNDSIFSGNEQQKVYINQVQPTEHFAAFSFSYKHWIPKGNGKIIVSINITNNISNGILVVVFGWASV